MGIVPNGICGKFSGKVGSIVGINSNGVNYVRSLPGKHRKMDSPAQLIQQARFTLMTKFIKGFGKLFSISFSDVPIGKTGRNLALSFNLKNGIKGDYPNFEINYPLIRVSGGNLYTAENPTISGEPGKVVFSWDKNMQTGVKGNDSALLVIYNPLTMQVFRTLQGGLRQDRTASFSVPALSGCTVETWIAFLSADAKQVSNSIYTGKVDIL